MTVDLDEAERNVDAMRRAGHAEVDAKCDELLRAIVTLRTMPPVPDGGKPAATPEKRITLTDGLAKRYAAAGAPATPAVAASPSVETEDDGDGEHAAGGGVGLTDAIRVALRELPEPYTSTKISGWLRTTYPALHPRRKYIPSVLNKLVPNELVKTRPGSATEPTEYRRAPRGTNGTAKH